MKNEYENETFFAQYAQMPRSKEGLSAAGEWHQLQRLMPELRGKRVLDLGCGYGWHCKYATDQGAAEVLGIDLVHFGIVMCINLTIAGFTPPFGSQMFTTCAITGCSIEKYAKQAIPFVAVLVAVLLLLTYIPGIVLLVPNLLA